MHREAGGARLVAADYRHPVAVVRPPASGLARLTPTPFAIVVLGPTASGKSELGARLARELGGEVINFDSRQVYRDMDIGTAKPSVQERGGVPHHLFDVAGFERAYSAADFSRHATALCEEIVRRGSLPILVGGTGLYLRALLGGLFEGPARSERIHGRLDAIAARGGLPRLFRWLQRVDPPWAEQVGARDRQRILRGLDVWLQSGRSISAHIAAQAPARFPFSVIKIGMDVPRDVLYRRIEARVGQLLTNGWLEEVRRLDGIPGFRDSSASKALGYRELTAHLGGELSLPAAIEQIVMQTRRLAKRQLTWFRREPETHWIPAVDSGLAFAAALGIVRPRILGHPISTVS